MLRVVVCGRAHDFALPAMEELLAVVEHAIGPGEVHVVPLFEASRKPKTSQKPPKTSPKTSQNGAKIDEKTMFKNSSFSATILERLFIEYLPILFKLFPPI